MANTMNSKLNLRATGPLKAIPLKKQLLPKNLSDRLMEGSVNSFFRGSSGTFLLQEVPIDGFKIGFHTFFMGSPVVAELSYHAPCVVIQYLLDATKCTYDGMDGIPFFESDQSFLYFLPVGHTVRLHLLAGEQSFFQVQFPVTLLEKLPLANLEMVTRINKRLPYFSSSIMISKKIRSIIGMLLNNARQKEPSVFYLNHRCLDLLRRFTVDHDVQLQLQSWADRKQPELDKFRDEVIQHLSDPDLLRSMLPILVKKMKVSVYQFKKISDQAFGMSLAAFIRTKRMEKAMELLTKTDTMIGDIGSTVGYVEFSSFSRAFTKHFGNPPSFYRPVK